MQRDEDILRDWLAAQLKAAPHGTRKALAAHLGVDSSAISRMTSDDPKKEGRMISGVELCRIAEYFHASLPVLPKVKVVRVEPKLPKIEAPPLQPNHIVPLMGYIGAGAEILPDFEQVPPEGLRDIELPFPVPEELIGLQVTGNSMFPRYEDGDVIVVWREQRTSFPSLVGEEVAVRTFTGHRYLKQLMAGKKKGTFDLRSVNEENDVIPGVRLEWASEIYVTVRAAQLQRVARREAAAGRPGRQPARR